MFGDHQWRNGVNPSSDPPSATPEYPFSMQDVERDTSPIVNPVGLPAQKRGYLFLANPTGDLHRVDLPVK